ncbi:hypothetical protein [uncultured Chitinophaga sp.]|nr:hypothetical protein [uncultured Chitinophaga sp.]
MTKVLSIGTMQLPRRHKVLMYKAYLQLDRNKVNKRKDVWSM